MQLQMQEQTERAQLIQDKEMEDYLNNCQLIHNPKHKETWSGSAANEFERLVQELEEEIKVPTPSFSYTKGKSHETE